MKNSVKKWVYSSIFICGTALLLFVPMFFSSTSTVEQVQEEVSVQGTNAEPKKPISANLINANFINISSANKAFTASWTAMEKAAWYGHTGPINIFIELSSGTDNYKQTIFSAASWVDIAGKTTEVKTYYASTNVSPIGVAETIYSNDVMNSNAMVPVVSIWWPGISNDSTNTPTISLNEQNQMVLNYYWIDARAEWNTTESVYSGDQSYTSSIRIYNETTGSPMTTSTELVSGTEGWNTFVFEDADARLTEGNVYSVEISSFDPEFKLGNHTEDASYFKTSPISIDATGIFDVIGPLNVTFDSVEFQFVWDSDNETVIYYTIVDTNSYQDYLANGTAPLIIEEGQMNYYNDLGANGGRKIFDDLPTGGTYTFIFSVEDQPLNGSFEEKNISRTVGVQNSNGNIPFLYSWNDIDASGTGDELEFAFKFDNPENFIMHYKLDITIDGVLQPAVTGSFESWDIPPGEYVDGQAIWALPLPEMQPTQNVQVNYYFSDYENFTNPDPLSQGYKWYGSVTNQQTISFTPGDVIDDTTIKSNSVGIKFNTTALTEDVYIQWKYYQVDPSTGNPIDQEVFESSYVLDKDIYSSGSYTIQTGEIFQQGKTYKVELKPSNSEVWVVSEQFTMLYNLTDPLEVISFTDNSIVISYKWNTTLNGNVNYEVREVTGSGQEVKLDVGTFNGKAEQGDVEIQLFGPKQYKIYFSSVDQTFDGTPDECVIEVNTKIAVQDIQITNVESTYFSFETTVNPEIASVASNSTFTVKFTSQKYSYTYGQITYSMQELIQNNGVTNHDTNELRNGTQISFQHGDSIYVEYFYYDEVLQQTTQIFSPTEIQLDKGVSHAELVNITGDEVNIMYVSDTKEEFTFYYQLYKVDEFGNWVEDRPEVAVSHTQSDTTQIINIKNLVFGTSYKIDIYMYSIETPPAITPPGYAQQDIITVELGDADIGITGIELVESTTNDATFKYYYDSEESYTFSYEVEGINNSGIPETEVNGVINPIPGNTEGTFTLSDSQSYQGLAPDKKYTLSVFLSPIPMNDVNSYTMEFWTKNLIQDLSVSASTITSTTAVITYDWSATHNHYGYMPYYSLDGGSTWTRVDESTLVDGTSSTTSDGQHQFMLTDLEANSTYSIMMATNPYEVIPGSKGLTSEVSFTTGENITNASFSMTDETSGILEFYYDPSTTKEDEVWVWVGDEWIDPYAADSLDNVPSTANYFNSWILISEKNILDYNLRSYTTNYFEINDLVSRKHYRLILSLDNENPNAQVNISGLDENEMFYVEEINGTYWIWLVVIGVALAVGILVSVIWKGNLFKRKPKYKREDII